MRDTTRVYSPPRTRIGRWLAEPGRDVPGPIRLALIANLYGTLPIFAGGVVNTIMVAAVIAVRLPQPHVVAWLVLEVAVCLSRLAVLVVADRAARAGRPTPTDLNLMLAVAWAATLGYGTFVSLVSGDWVAATLACLSSAAMVGGTCFRNFSAPRLTGVMIALTLGPCCLGAALTGEPLLAVTFIQIPFYLLAMTRAAYRLNGLLVATMRAEREIAALAHHDGLTGLANRAGLTAAFERSGTQAPGLLYLDLDGFKAVNDTHGHAVGDRLLRSVAERIAEAAGPALVPARIGGDEFVVLCPGHGRGALIDLGERLIARIAAPHPMAGRRGDHRRRQRRHRHRARARHRPHRPDARGRFRALSRQVPRQGPLQRRLAQGRGHFGRGHRGGAARSGAAERLRRLPSRSSRRRMR